MDDDLTPHTRSPGFTPPPKFIKSDRPDITREPGYEAPERKLERLAELPTIRPASPVPVYVSSGQEGEYRELLRRHARGEHLSAENLLDLSNSGILEAVAAERKALLQSEAPPMTEAALADRIAWLAQMIRFTPPEFQEELVRERAAKLASYREVTGRDYAPDDK